MRFRRTFSVPGIPSGPGARGRRRLSRGAFLVSAVATVVFLVAFGYHSLLRGAGEFLVVEDPLEPAAAIVALNGRMPFRELAAAKIYRAGIAPSVVVVPGGEEKRNEALHELGIDVEEEWERRRDVLLRSGVPAGAIRVAEGRATSTEEEIRIVARAIEPSTKPVILVTSEYHTRRARLLWNGITGGRPKGLVRGVPDEHFDPDGWWRDRDGMELVAHEYLGLLAYGLGLPRSDSGTSAVTSRN